VKSDPQKWYATQRRARLKYANKLRMKKTNQSNSTGVLTKAVVAEGVDDLMIKLAKLNPRSKNEYPMALFNADRWFRRWVVASYSDCVTANNECSGPPEASHVFPVSVSSIYRFDERLVYRQCRFHNQKHSSDSTLLRDYVDRRHGRGFYDKIKIHSTQIKRWTIPELRGIMEKYHHKYQELINLKDSI
jgi:hypothetical protein